MNEWFKKLFGTIKEKWAKWTILQKGIAGGIVAVVIVAIIVMASVSSRPTTVRLFNSPITNEQERSNIGWRLEQDNVWYDTDASGYIYVKDAETANRYRSKLIAEGYEPTSMDAYSLFDVTKWSRTDFDDKVNWKRATENALKNHLEQLDGIQRAHVVLTLPEDSMFKSQQKPVTASVILYSKGGSDVLSSKKQIKGIQRLIQRSVEGLLEDNISIVDGSTNEEINNFDDMAETDRISNIEKQQKLILKLETEYSSAVLAALTGTFGEKRVRIANMKIDMNMSQRSSTSEKYSGIEIKSDNPNTSYDDSLVVETLPLSYETVEKTFDSTGFNPEGPAGVDGQNPAVYSDASNLIGHSVEKGVKQNNALNKTNTVEETSPQIDRITLSVNIDGKWSKVYDESGKVVLDSKGAIKREYEPISQEELAKITQLVRDAVGYSAVRGDSVTVTNVAFDRSAEFEAEDEEYRRSQQRARTVLFSLIGLAVVLISFIMFRIISREMERRRRIREEEELRKQQAQREQALWEAKDQAIEVTMSVEERKRAELQENATAMAKEHPEDVAMLIRTWLMEE